MQFALYKDQAASELLHIVSAYTSSREMRNTGYGHKKNITINGKTSEIFRGNSTIYANIGESSGSVWIVPDPDETRVEHGFYTESGTRFIYTHYRRGYSQQKPYTFVLYTPSISNGTDYETPFTDENNTLLSFDYNYTTERIELSWISGDYSGRDYTYSEEIWRGKALAPFVRFRDIRTGSLSDMSINGAMSANFIDISAYGTHPYKPTKNSRAGGKGLGTYHGRQNGERPDIANRNAVTTFGGSGDGLTYYQLGSVHAVHQVLAYAYGLGAVKDNSYVRASLVSAYILPVLNISKTSATGVRLADRTFSAYSFNPPTTIEMLNVEHISARKTCFYDFGELDGTGTFLDFTRTKFALFLPFVGTINLNPNAVQWRRLQVDWYIDAYNGNIVYWVYTTSIDSETDELYGTYTGNCAIEIPLAGVGETGSMLGKITNLVSNLAVGAASIATANPVGVAGAAAGMINSAAPTYYVDRSGAVDTNGSAVDAWNISLKISMPHELRADTSNKLGRPAFFRSKISALPNGRHVCQGVETDGIQHATAAEKEQIRMILERGFYK